MGTHYCHLKLDERRKLAKWLEAKMPISEIADRLGRDPSTIYRDIKRNRYTDGELPELNGYHALVAQDKYEQRRAIHRKMIIHPDLKAAIENRLKAGWSPEQIAGRMRLERHPIRVSHETIYRFAYSKDGREEQFYRHLPEHRRFTHSGPAQQQDVLAGKRQVFDDLDGAEDRPAHPAGDADDLSSPVADSRDAMERALDPGAVVLSEIADALNHVF